MRACVFSVEIFINIDVLSPDVFFGGRGIRNPPLQDLDPPMGLYTGNVEILLGLQ